MSGDTWAWDLVRIVTIDHWKYNDRPIAAGRNPRLLIPPLLFSDGPRGVVLNHSTAFPVAIARGASFDRALEARVADAIGRELRAQGANLYGGVCINVLRHPGWGRAQETYGEDPYLLGEMAARHDPRGAAPQRHGLRQAFRPQQHRRAAPHRGRAGGRADPARGVPAPVPKERSRPGWPRS